MNDEARAELQTKINRSIPLSEAMGYCITELDDDQIAVSLAFYGENGRSRRVFSSDSQTGSLVVLDADQDEVVETIAVAEGQPHSRIWMLSP